MIFLRLFFEFFKTGLFSIGGGLATIPFLQDMGEATGWFTNQELTTMIAVSESTPGPMGVNMATYVGYHMGCNTVLGPAGGILGAVIATLGLVAPSIIVILIIARFLQKFRHSRTVEAAFQGLRPASTALIVVAGLSVAFSVFFGLPSVSFTGITGVEWKAVVLAAAVFAAMKWSPLKKLHPICFILSAAVIGVAAIVATVYTPAYVVEQNGIVLGTVSDPQVFEDAVDRVETRASQILGYDYTLDSDFTYEFALTEPENITPTPQFETYLFDQIGEVMKNYVLTVDGQFIGAAQDRSVLDGVLDQVKAAYVNENTVSSEFVGTVSISHQYTASDVNQDTQVMLDSLTANTNGQTVYEVQKGDTFMQIALDNGMTVSEMSELNPDVDINVIYIGQLLNVKEEIPFLSVKTVDNVTYTEEIACPVVEVEDDSMYQGESRVIDAGVPGEQIVNADIAYLNGVEQERTVLSTQVTREATNKVIAVGTKVRPSWLPNGYFIWPVYGNITSYFGYRSIFGSYSYHGGIDIATSYGTTIKASDGGTVVWSGTGTGSYWSFGKYVVIDHGNGVRTIYAHCSSLLVSAGDHVSQGQAIARVGSTGRSTGNHCHFEMQINGTPVNPLSYLN